jgi:hypothetical protein
MPIETITKVSKTTKICTSDGSGNYAGTIGKMNGIIDRVTIVPGTSGDQPDADFDITIKDDLGVDIMKTLGTNCSQTLPTTCYPAVPVDSALTIAISGMGATHKATVYIYRR